MTNLLPSIEPAAQSATRGALHAYSRIMGGWLATSRRRRKHWWHASLRPSLCGLTTGVIPGAVAAEIELDLAASRVNVRTSSGAAEIVTLTGQSSRDIGGRIERTLLAAGVAANLVPGDKVLSDDQWPDYSADQSADMQQVLSFVSAALADFRAGIREETSPIQLWPHHFDLSMIWLPGAKIAGQDPADEEHSDKQMNFGFTFGDDGIPEPYFYVTAYPLPDVLPRVKLPAGTEWRSDGFSGAVLPYRELARMSAPRDYLVDMWTRLLTAARPQLAATDARGPTS